jgi:hypothetical protein
VRSLIPNSLACIVLSIKSDCDASLVKTCSKICLRCVCSLTKEFDIREVSIVVMSDATSRMKSALEDVEIYDSSTKTKGSLTYTPRPHR